MSKNFVKGKLVQALICFMLVSCFIFAGLPVFADNADFAGGSGTQADPWLISTPGQLDSLRNYVGRDYADEYFALANDIDLTEYLAPGGAGYAKWGENGWEPIGASAIQYEQERLQWLEGYEEYGEEWFEIGGDWDENWDTEFEGNLTGGGHVVSGLWMNRPELFSVGLFAVLYGADGLRVEAGAKGVTGGYSTGILAGIAYGDITNCVTAGDVFFNVNEDTPLVEDNNFSPEIYRHAVAGGLIGRHEDGDILNCSSDSMVQSVDEDIETIGFYYCGGLIGIHTNGLIENCSASGNIQETGSARYAWAHGGGLIGYAKNANG